jgi:hypothetical protein
MIYKTLFELLMYIAKNPACSVVGVILYAAFVAVYSVLDKLLLLRVPGPAMGISSTGIKIGQ